MVSALILSLASSEFTVIGNWVDEVMVNKSSFSFNEIVLFAPRGKTFNDSSVLCSFDVVVTSISADNDDDVVEWGDVVDGTFVLNCNDNVVISEAGVETVVTENRK